MGFVSRISLQRGEREKIADLLFLVFFPFWIFGAIILLLPLRAPQSAHAAPWLPEKTDVERQQIITELRSVEVKWAKRCLYALCALSVTIAVVAITLWAVLRS